MSMAEYHLDRLIEAESDLADANEQIKLLQEANRQLLQEVEKLNELVKAKI